MPEQDSASPEEQAEIRRDRPHWAQIPEPLILDQTLSSQAVRVYALLDRYADTHRVCFPGQDRLASQLGVSRGTVSRAIAELKTSGWLTIDRRRNNSNLYTVLTSRRAPDGTPDVADIAQPEEGRAPERAPVVANIAPPVVANIAQEPESVEPEKPHPQTPSPTARTPVDRKIVAAAAILVEEEIQRRTDLHNPAGYRRSRLPAVISEHDPTWRLLLEVEPELTADDLATAAHPVAHARPDPLDGMAAAQRARLKDWTGTGQGEDRHPAYLPDDDHD